MTYQQCVISGEWFFLHKMLEKKPDDCPDKARKRSRLVKISFFKFYAKNIKRKKFRAWSEKCSVLWDEEPDTIDQQRFTKLQVLAREITTDWRSIEKFALKRGDLIEAQMHASQTRLEKEKAEIAELKKKYPCPFEICDCPLSNNVPTWPVAV